MRAFIKSALDAFGLRPFARTLYGKYSAAQFVRMTNKTTIFHTLSPNLLVAIVRAFRHLEKHNPHLLETGSYLEFGLYKGFALWFAERVSKEYAGNFALFGFDSFSGLPKSVVDGAEPYWSPGAYSCSEDEVIRHIKSAGGDLSRIRLVSGWYSKELFAGTVQDIATQKPAIVVIDSDVYESCQIILQEFGPLFQKGTIILFDNFNNLFEKNDEHGERRALKEFQEGHRDFKIAPLFSFGWSGEAFEVRHEA